MVTWDEYCKDLSKGYYEVIDGKKCMKPAFIVEYPQMIVKELRDRKRNKPSQIRKYCDYARGMNDRLKRGNVTLNMIKADLLKMIPVVYSALTRDTVTIKFKLFIEKNLNQIKDKDDLDAFVKHFQALMAYLPKESR